MVTIENRSGVDIIYNVMDSEVMIGRVVKGRGYKYPWRAYAVDRPHEVLGSFYQKEGGRKAAITLIVERYRLGIRQH